RAAVDDDGVRPGEIGHRDPGVGEGQHRADDGELGLSGGPLVGARVRYPLAHVEVRDLGRHERAPARVEPRDLARAAHRLVDAVEEALAPYPGGRDGPQPGDLYSAAHRDSYRPGEISPSGSKAIFRRRTIASAPSGAGVSTSSLYGGRPAALRSATILALAACAPAACASSKW